jgi:hypothetical protein
MLGRGALADPALARAAARELGITRATPPAPDALAGWLPLVRDFADHCARAGFTPAATAARVKQWLHLANHDGKLPWFDLLKRRQGLDEVLDHLSRLAAAGEAGPCRHRSADERGQPSRNEPGVRA